MREVLAHRVLSDFTNVTELQQMMSVLSTYTKASGPLAEWLGGAERSRACCQAAQVMFYREVATGAPVAWQPGPQPQHFS